MSSSQNSQIKSKSKTHKSQHEETYNLVLKCEHIVKNRARRPIRRKLREQTTFFTCLSIFQLIHANNIFSKISICLGEFFLNLSKFKKLNNYFNYCKYFLFKKPNIIFFIPLIFSGVLFVFLVPLIQLLKLLKWYNTTIQVILFLGISAIFIFSVVFPYIIIPRVIVEHDSKWMDVKKIYLRYIRRNILKQKDFIKEAKNRLKRAIDYYRRKGEIWDLLLAFTWGSIFIGSLPDQGFQDAIWEAFVKLIEAKSIFDCNLYKEMFLRLWCENKFATICFFSVPFVIALHAAVHQRPIAIMEKVLNEIEFDE